MGSAGKSIFADSLRMTLTVNVIALITIVGSFVILANLSSGSSIYVLGSEVSPDWQVYNAAWAALGIPVAIIGGVGAVYQISVHLGLYKFYLFGSAIVEAIWIVHLIFSASSTWAATLCTSAKPSDDSAASFAQSFSCGLTISITVLMMLAALAITIGVAAVIGSAEQYIKTRHATAFYSSSEAWTVAKTIVNQQETTVPSPITYAAPVPAAPLGVSMPYPMTAPTVTTAQTTLAAPPMLQTWSSTKALPISATVISSRPASGLTSGSEFLDPSAKIVPAQTSPAQPAIQWATVASSSQLSVAAPAGAEQRPLLHKGSVEF